MYEVECTQSSFKMIEIPHKGMQTCHLLHMVTFLWPQSYSALTTLPITFRGYVRRGKSKMIPTPLVHNHVCKPQNLHSWADTDRQHTSPLVKENFYQYQEHLKFVCILFSSTLNNFTSQITGVPDQSASRLVLETQECYATLWYSTSIFQFNNRLTCAHTPWDERRKEREREKDAGKVDGGLGSRYKRAG